MICELLKKFCEKRTKLKVKKNTIEIEQVSLPPIDTLPEPFKIALNEVGIKEYSGENHNPRIIEYHKSCDLRAKSDEISWCSAFMNWCFEQCELENTKSAAAISWAKWGEQTNDPKVGDIVVFRRLGSSWRGHVGFYVAQDEKRILVLGGNQGNTVSFQWYPKKGTSIYFHQFRTIKK